MYADCIKVGFVSVTLYDGSDCVTMRSQWSLLERERLLAPETVAGGQREELS